MSRIGLSHTRPKNEARPLGTPKMKVVRNRRSIAGNRRSIGDYIIEAVPEPQKVVDAPIAPVVDLPQVEAILPTPKEQKMILTLKTLSKNGRRAIYTGAAQTIAIRLGAFPDKTAPQTIEVADVFAVKAVKAPRVKLTDEEKAAAKLARKNAPKKTLAERARLAQVRADKLAAKVAAASSM